MRIAVLVEGKTETAFKPHLVDYLKKRLAGRMPRLDFTSYDGRIPTEKKLKRIVENLLRAGSRQADAVVALTDVYTGTTPYVFPTAQVAKSKTREWVGEEPRFHPHVALHDFEAWLLPYWDRIKEITGCNRRSPGSNPERVNHGNSPAYRLAEVFRIGKEGWVYQDSRRRSNPQGAGSRRGRRRLSGTQGVPEHDPGVERRPGALTLHVGVQTSTTPAIELETIPS